VRGERRGGGIERNVETETGEGWDGMDDATRRNVTPPLAALHDATAAPTR
jgi:hypothetical protein